MKQLLESEGLVIKNDQIHDFKLFFWDPNKELEQYICNLESF